MDYESLNLQAYVNADDSIDNPHIEVWRGQTLLRGLPFLFTEQEGIARVVRISPGDRLAIPVVAAPEPNPFVRTLTFAHRSREYVGPGTAPLGKENATYVFT